jgi:hypothetical protein
VSTEITPPDLELWATGYLRALLAARDRADVAVDVVEPTSETFPAALVIVRDDGGPRRSLVSWSRALGVSVLAGTRRRRQPAVDLARMLFGAMSDIELPRIAGAPIASVDDANGPFRVAEAQDRTRMYFTVEYTVFGSPAAY